MTAGGQAREITSRPFPSYDDIIHAFPMDSRGQKDSPPPIIGSDSILFRGALRHSCPIVGHLGSLISLRALPLLVLLSHLTFECRKGCGRECVSERFSTCSFLCWSTRICGIPMISHIAHLGSGDDTTFTRWLVAKSQVDTKSVQSHDIEERTTIPKLIWVSIRVGGIGR